MQHTRVIVCKLGRLGELRKVVDTSAGQLQPDPGTEEGQTKNTGCHILKIQIFFADPSYRSEKVIKNCFQIIFFKQNTKC